MVAAVSSLCSSMSCDQFCEVSMTPSGGSEAHCVCTVGYTRVRVTGSQRCDSESRASSLRSSTFFHDHRLQSRIFSRFWLDRPFCNRDLMFCACFFFFICQLTFSDVRQPIFSKLFHMTWLQPRRKLLIFWKCPLTKMRGENPQISPNFAFNCIILSAITREVEEK